MQVPLEGKVLLLANISENDKILFLYSEGSAREELFITYLKNGLEKNHYCIYAYPIDKARIVPELAFPQYKHTIKLVQLEYDELEEPDIAKSLDRISKVFKFKDEDYEGVRVLIDYGNLITSENIDLVITTELQMRTREIPITWFSAVNTSQLDFFTSSKLLKNYSKVIISTKSEHTVLLPSMDVCGKINEEVEHKVISQEITDDFVKSSLETIVLSILSKKPMCGLDIIKIIHKSFNVLLSHGTVYPLLYSLKEKNILVDELGEDMKSRIYKPSDKGKIYVNEMLEKFTQTHRHLLVLLDKGLT